MLLLATMKTAFGLLATACFLATWTVPADAAAPAPRQERIAASVAGGSQFLLSQIGLDGAVLDEYPADDARGRYGLATAAAVEAMLAAGADAEDIRLQGAIHWLLQAELSGTPAVAARAKAMAAWRDEQARARLEQDARLLIEAGREGLYRHFLAERPGDPGPSNQMAHLALLGVWAADQRGVAVPDDFYRAADEHWRDQQLTDGSWGHVRLPLPRRTRAYPAMTAAGVESLAICRRRLGQEGEALGLKHPQADPIEAGLAWLGDNFSILEGPDDRYSWRYYWLYAVGRLGRQMGYKHFGEHPWFAEGAADLLADQNRDGSWGYREKTYHTALAVLFLAEGHQPIIVNKLRYRGRWNARPQDAANLAAWIGWTFERPVRWQIVDVDSPLADWHDAPILYISGGGPCSFSDAQIARLRNYVLRGGTILAEVAGSNGDFTLDMQQAYRRVLPQFDLRPLESNDPAYTLQYAGDGGLSGISNGVRTLVYHSARDLSRALQAGAGDDNRPTFELMANVYLLATDMGRARSDGESYWPEARAFEPAATIRVARVKYDGNYDPEPMAWPRLAVEMGNRHHIRLDGGEFVEMQRLDAAEHPIAAMTGTDGFTLGAEQAEALRRYLAEGGTLIIDAAGGSKEFDKAFEDQIVPLAGGVYGPVASDHAIYRTPEPIGKTKFRRGLAAALGAASDEPRLRAVSVDGRLAIMYSQDDLTAGLVGYEHHGIDGYTPQAAWALMTNILCHAAGVNRGAETQPTTATEPASEPQPAPQRQAASGTQPAPQTPSTPGTQPAPQTQPAAETQPRQRRS